jgi:hypothetical protein
MFLSGIDTTTSSPPARRFRRRGGASARAELLHEERERLRTPRVAHDDVVAACDREPRELAADVPCTDEADGHAGALPSRRRRRKPHPGAPDDVAAGGPTSG